MTARATVGRLTGALFLASLALGGCEGFFGDPEPPPLPGERIPVLKLDTGLIVDSEAAKVPVSLPAPTVNADWPQPGGLATHVMQHLSLSGGLNLVWSADIGSGADATRAVLAEPIVIGGRVLTLDSDSNLRAFDLQSGRLVWDLDLTPDEEDDDLFGGGIASDGRLIYVTTPFQEVQALDPSNGALVWVVDLQAPLRTAPSVSDGRVFVVTVTNQLFVLAADDGRELWTYSGVTELAGLLGGASPAASGFDLVVPFSSGDLIAFNVESGAVNWTESLAGGARSESLSQLADIRGRPAIDRDLAIAVSHSGVTAAIDLVSGGRVWSQKFGGNQSPWVAGDYVYLLTRDGELICLTRAEGRVRWVQVLPRFEDEEDNEGAIYWVGPVLGSDRLIVAGSHGQALSISPYTGEILGSIDLPDGTHVPPVIAGDILFIVTDSGELLALR